MGVRAEGDAKTVDRQANTKIIPLPLTLPRASHQTGAMTRTGQKHPSIIPKNALAPRNTSYCVVRT